MANARDVDKATEAARRAFASFNRTTREVRLALMRRVLKNYEDRAEDLAWAISSEMGAPIEFARRLQVGSGAVNLRSAISALESYSFVESLGSTKVMREPIGVCGLITPWNWPMNQITAKVAAALGAGTLDESLDTTRINPPKFTAYAEWHTSENVTVRGQVLYSGDQNLFPEVDNAGGVFVFVRNVVDNYILADFLLTWRNIGPGTFSAAVHNLFIEDYFTPSALRFNSTTTYSTGPGASVSLKYRVAF